MNTDALVNYLLQFATLNKQQVGLIVNSVTVKTFAKGEYFLKAGQTAKEIGFIVNGIFRVCYYDNNGDEITRYFIDENNFMADINSYNTGIATTEYIEAITDCEVLVFTKQAMETLSQTIIVWDSIISKITTKALAEKVAKLSMMMPQDAKTRYENFFAEFPSLANRIPLQYIASYIGVTKSSLSRIRKEMSKG